MTNKFKLLLNKVERLTDKNYHTDAIYTIAKYYKQLDICQSLMAIKKSHKLNGYMPYYLIEIRNQLRNELLNRLNNQVSEDDILRIKSKI